MLRDQSMSSGEAFGLRSQNFLQQCKHGFNLKVHFKDFFNSLKNVVANAVSSTRYQAQ